MQEQEITYLSLQSTYHGIEVALLRNETVLQKSIIDKFKACKQLLPTIDTFLTEQSMSLAELSFIGVTAGPAPFTTLRTAIVTANGISYASGIPVLSVNALQVMTSHYGRKPVAALLYAYSGEVYYGIATGDSFRMGSAKVNHVLSTLQEEFMNQQLHIIGNAHLHYPEQFAMLPDHFVLQKELPYPPVEATAQEAYHAWLSGTQGTHHVSPLYLKQPIS